jgi:glycosyltransferase involved in cell wall biosynthesis
MSQAPPPLLVSIVISSYNYEPYLREAIDSALAQTYPHTEVIVVDDGSTDGSPEIIRSYGDAVTAVFKPNGGQASSLSAGFAASRGDIVLFLDSDDMFFPEAVARVVAAYRPGVSKIQFRLQVVDAQSVPTGRYLPPMAYRLPNGSERANILAGRPYPSPPSSGNAYTREVLQRVMPLPEDTWRMYVDTYCLILAGLLGEVASIEQPCGRYRVHGKNFSGFGVHALDIGWLHTSTDLALRRANLVREWAAKLGLTAGPHLAYRYPGEMTRMMALKLAQPHHCFVENRSRAWFARQGIAAILGDAHPTRLHKRVAGVAWFAAMALLPRAAALKLAAWSLADQTQPVRPLAPKPA